MAKISLRRQRLLEADTHAVQTLIDAAYQQWGKEAVEKDHTRIWDLRCIWGMKRILPFNALVAQNISEILWVAESLCGLGKKHATVAD